MTVEGDALVEVVPAVPPATVVDDDDVVMDEDVASVSVEEANAAVDVSRTPRPFATPKADRPIPPTSAFTPVDDGQDVTRNTTSSSDKPFNKGNLGVDTDRADEEERPMLFGNLVMI